MAGGLKKQAEEEVVATPSVKEEVAAPKQKVQEPAVEQAQESVVVGHARRDFRN